MSQEIRIDNILCLLLDEGDEVTGRWQFHLLAGSHALVLLCTSIDSDVQEVAKKDP